MKSTLGRARSASGRLVKQASLMRRLLVRTPSADAEDAQHLLSDAYLDDYLAEGFTAGVAITLLLRARHDARATERVARRLVEYAPDHEADVEFYLPQILHLAVTAEEAVYPALETLVLGLCHAQSYDHELGNSIHLALQIFWHLRAVVDDLEGSGDDYNRVARLLLSVEARVVDPDAHGVDDVVRRQPELLRMRLLSEDGAEVEAAEEEEKTGDELTPEQAEKLREWLVRRRKERYQYFVSQRDLWADIAEICERMRHVTPPSERRPLLPGELAQLRVPPNSYVPLCTAGSPFRAVVSVPPDEGHVFSTHARAPVLICFEVVAREPRAASASSAPMPAAGLLPPPSPALDVSDSEIRGMILASSATAEELLVSGDGWARVALGDDFALSGALPAGARVALVPADAQDPGFPDEPQWGATLSAPCERLAVTYDAEARVATVGEHSFADVPSGCRLVVAAPGELDLCVEPAAAAVGEDDQQPQADDDQQDDFHPELVESSVPAYSKGSAVLGNLEAAFGESWEDKVERLRAASEHGAERGWDVTSVIAKSFDDLRQEVFALQLIAECRAIFREAGLPLYLRPYRIVATGNSTGLIETLTDALSLDAIKKSPGFVNLAEYFRTVYCGACAECSRERHVEAAAAALAEDGEGEGERPPLPPDSPAPAGRPPQHTDAYRRARRNFVESLAAYSVVCYVLQIKDRHNGNILLSRDGHLVHIDFGFLLGIAPGGRWSLEKAPFKLTREMVEAMGGQRSALYTEFTALFVQGMLALQRNADKLLLLVEIMAERSPFPCFQGRERAAVIDALQRRLMTRLSKRDAINHAMKLIRDAHRSYFLTMSYDKFQLASNGIAV